MTGTSPHSLVEPFLDAAAARQAFATTRGLARYIVLAVAEDRHDWDNTIHAMKLHMVKEARARGQKVSVFADLPTPDKARVSTFLHHCRTIVAAWPTLPEQVHQDFRAGKIVYSTLANEIKSSSAAVAEVDLVANPEVSRDEGDATSAGEPTVAGLAVALSRVLRRTQSLNADDRDALADLLPIIIEKAQTC